MPFALDVFAFMGFLAVVSGIIGVQMFRGHTLSRCEYGSVDLQAEMQPDKFPLVQNDPALVASWSTLLNVSSPNQKPAIGAAFVAMSTAEIGQCRSMEMKERTKCTVQSRPRVNAATTGVSEYPIGIGIWYTYCTVDADCPLYNRPDGYNRTQVRFWLYLYLDL